MTTSRSVDATFDPIEEAIAAMRHTVEQFEAGERFVARVVERLCA